MKNKKISLIYSIKLSTKLLYFINLTYLFDRSVQIHLKLLH